MCGTCFSGYGIFTEGATTFINASICTHNYLPTNEPIIFDIPLPPSVTKKDFLANMSVLPEKN